MEYMIGMLIALIVIMYVSMPLFRQMPATQTAWGMSRRMEDLLAEKTTVFAAIRNLEVDHDTGNVPDDEYRVTYDQLKSRAVGLLKEIDDLKKHPGRAAKQTKKQAKPTPPSQKPVQKQSVTIYACPECGKGYVKGDAFCAGCGCKLK